MSNIFYILTFLSFFISCSLLIFSKKIAFRSPSLDTDNEKVLIASSQYKLFSWPSSLHKIKNARCELREYWAIGLKIISLFYILRILNI